MIKAFWQVSARCTDLAQKAFLYRILLSTCSCAQRCCHLRSPGGADPAGEPFILICRLVLKKDLKPWQLQKYGKPLRYDFEFRRKTPARRVMITKASPTVMLSSGGIGKTPQSFRKIRRATASYPCSPVSLHERFPIPRNLQREREY